MTFDPGTVQSNRFQAFFQALRDLGYVDGQTIVLDYLSAEGDGARYPALAAECVRRRASVIVTSTTPAAQAAKNATQTIPIVMLALGDPIGSGLVSSLARPGGNVTGLSFMAPRLAAKRLELLKEALPRLSRVLVLIYLPDPIVPPQVEEMKAVARSLGVTLHLRDVRTADELAPAFESAAKEQPEALLVTAVSIFFVHRARVIELAARYRLPALYPFPVVAEEGGLMAYAHVPSDLYRRAADYVDKTLKGAKPADLPVEQPTKFHFIVNLKTAKSLGITIPPSLLLRADHVIQ